MNILYNVSLCCPQNVDPAVLAGAREGGQWGAPREELDPRPGRPREGPRRLPRQGMLLTLPGR